MLEWVAPSQTKFTKQTDDCQRIKRLLLLNTTLENKQEHKSEFEHKNRLSQAPMVQVVYFNSVIVTEQSYFGLFCVFYRLKHSVEMI